MQTHGAHGPSANLILSAYLCLRQHNTSACELRLYELLVAVRRSMLQHGRGLRSRISTRHPAACTCAQRKNAVHRAAYALALGPQVAVLAHVARRCVGASARTRAGCRSPVRCTRRRWNLPFARVCPAVFSVSNYAHSAQALRSCRGPILCASRPVINRSKLDAVAQACGKQYSAQ